MSSGKLLRISDERSIFIIQNEDESYINKDNLIRYRNIGPTFELVIINESYTNLDSTQQLHILDNSGNSKFHFPVIWLDTTHMKLIALQEEGILKLK